jgi:hypothetical protein
MVFFGGKNHPSTKFLTNSVFYVATGDRIEIGLVGQSGGAMDVNIPAILRDRVYSVDHSGSSSTAIRVGYEIVEHIDHATRDLIVATARVNMLRMDRAGHQILDRDNNGQGPIFQLQMSITPGRLILASGRTKF